MLIYVLVCLFIRINAFNPFVDNDLYAINWAGPTDIDKLKENGDLEIVTIKTEDDEKYHCVIPESQEKVDANRKAAYKGDTPEELMKTLFTQTSCSYRIESYWTYELCHGKHIRQYHESKELGLQKPKSQEYFLGRIAEEKDVKSEEAIKEKEEEDNLDGLKEAKQLQEIKSIKLDGLDLPYFSVNMTDGTVCDLTGKPRKSHLMYICQPNGRGEIYLLKETSSCEYDIVVLTAVLCTHPQFKPKDPPVSKIQCFSSGKSPYQPIRLSLLESTSAVNMVIADEEANAEMGQGGVKNVPPKPIKHPPPRPDTIIGQQADKQLLREFLLGDYCLRGSAGWWKHEFCYKKAVRQFHEEADSLTEIHLGYWNQEKHLQWLEKYPHKRPMPVGQRKHISMFYTDGDLCDLTGVKRFVEVRLKCLNKPAHPHAVTIYLVEPKTCEYTLVVESPIFCELLDKADHNGLLEHIEI